MNMLMDPVALMEGVYRKVAIGFTIADWQPLWSVDIETNQDGVTVVGNGKTLEEAAADAVTKITGYREPCPTCGHRP